MVHVRTFLVDKTCEDRYCFVYRGFHFDMITNLNMYIATIFKINESENLFENIVIYL